MPTDPPQSQEGLEREEPTNLELDRIRRSVRIEEFIGQFLDLRRSGSTLRSECPFHAGEKESFVVFPSTQTFHCFGCSAHGTVLTFLMRIEHLTLPDAVQKLQRLTAHDQDREES